MTMISQSKLPMSSAISDSRASRGARQCARNFRGAGRAAARPYNGRVGKSEVKTIRVPRAVTVSFLLLVTAAIAAMIYWLSGRAMLHERVTITELLSLVRRYDRGLIGTDALLASVAPAVVDVLLFVPWGVLAFLSLDRGESHRVSTYALTIAVGVAFALALVAWQNRLPTRVTGWYDALWNSAGCIAGAVLGDLRKRVRIRFA